MLSNNICFKKIKLHQLFVNEAKIVLQNNMFYLYNTFLTALITSLWLGNHSANKTGE